MMFKKLHQIMTTLHTFRQLANQKKLSEIQLSQMPFRKYMPENAISATALGYVEQINLGFMQMDQVPVKYQDEVEHHLANPLARIMKEIDGVWELLENDEVILEYIPSSVYQGINHTCLFYRFQVHQVTDSPVNEIEITVNLSDGTKFVCYRAARFFGFIVVHNIFKKGPWMDDLIKYVDRLHWYIHYHIRKVNEKGSEESIHDEYMNKYLLEDMRDLKKLESKMKEVNSNVLESGDISSLGLKNS